MRESVDARISINQPMADTGICICLYISITSLGGLAPKQTLKTTILIPETASEEEMQEFHYFCNHVPQATPVTFHFPLNSCY